MTLPFSEAWSCSLFANLSHDPDNPYFMPSAFGQVQDENAKLVEACWHEFGSGNESALQWPCVLPALNFLVSCEGFDPECEHSKLPDSDACCDDHKLGGYPYFYQPTDRVIEVTHMLMAEGFHHHLQLSFPGAEDADVNCDWPFGGYTFHVFARARGGDSPPWELRTLWS